MIRGRGRKLNIKLLTVCFLAVGFFAPAVYSDAFFDDLPDLPEQIKNIHKSFGPIYLDSSKVEHPDIQMLFPTPSEYKMMKDSADQKNNTTPTQQLSREENSLTPINSESTLKNNSDSSLSNTGSAPASTEQNNVNSFGVFDFFAPPSEYKKTKPIAEKSTTPIEHPEVHSPEASYYASAEETSGDIELEGKTINGLSFNGLRLVDENTVLNRIQTRNGSVFNTERLQHDLQNIYYTGYFTDNMNVEPTLNNDGTVSLEFSLQENPEIKEVEITGNKVFSENELLLYTKNLKGMPQNLYEINTSIEKINEHYHNNGYILAKVASVDDTKDGTLILGISEGVIDKIVFEGDKKTKDYVIRRNIMTEEGSVYNEELLKKDLSRIYATQIFDEVDRKIEPSPDKEGEYIVTIVVKEASSNSISIGGGVDSALGVFGSLSILEKNFLGRGQELGLSGMLGSGLLLSDASIKNRMNYQIELNFREPHFINADNSLISKIYIRELGSYQVPLAIERRFGFNGIVHHKFKNNDKLSSEFGIGYENINLKEGDIGSITDLYNKRGINISQRAKQLTGGNFVNFAPGIQYCSLDNDFMPREGIIAKANFVESLSVGNMKQTNGRLQGGVTRYIPVFEKSTLSVGAKGGIKVHGNEMPEVMAFRLGGPYSIRGFRMSGVGTGDSYLMGSVELQTPIPLMDRFKYDVLKNLRFAFFIDAGRIWNPTITSTLYDRPNSAIAAGIGLRVNIPGLGPISIDYGLPLTHVGEYNSKRGYFTFGTGGLYDSY